MQPGCLRARGDHAGKYPTCAAAKAPDDSRVPIDEEGVVATSRLEGGAPEHPQPVLGGPPYSSAWRQEGPAPDSTPDHWSALKWALLRLPGKPVRLRHRCAARGGESFAGTSWGNETSHDHPRTAAPRRRGCARPVRCCAAARDQCWLAEATSCGFTLSPRGERL